MSDAHPPDVGLPGTASAIAQRRATRRLVVLIQAIAIVLGGSWAAWHVVALATSAGATLDHFERVLSLLTALVGVGTVVWFAQKLGTLSAQVSTAHDDAIVSEAMLVAERLHTEHLTRTIAMAGHEIRSPVTVIQGYVGLLQTPDLPPETKAFYHEEITKAVGTLQGMVDDMRNVAVARDGKLPVELEQVSVADVVAEAFNHVRPSTGKHSVLVDVPHDCPPVLVDRARLVQVLTNLLTNAVKYSPAGGQVEVTAVIASAGQLVLKVADQGVGIPPEDRARLFVPYSRIAHPDTAHVGGLGLGLYIAKNLVELMGGSIAVESEPGRGTTFSVFLAAVRVAHGA